LDEQQKNLFLIKLAYWLGIGADALWAVVLLFPLVFGLLTGRPILNPVCPVNPVKKRPE